MISNPKFLHIKGITIHILMGEVVVFQAIFCKSKFLIYSYLIYWSLHTRSVKLINTMYGPLKASPLLGEQAGSGGISSALLCMALVELPCVQSGCTMPQNTSGPHSKSPFKSEKRGGGEIERGEVRRTAPRFD